MIRTRTTPHATADNLAGKTPFRDEVRRPKIVRPGLSQISYQTLDMTSDLDIIDVVGTTKNACYTVIFPILYLLVFCLASSLFRPRRIALPRPAGFFY